MVHLILKHKCLKEVNASIMAVWKLMKYSSVKATVFGTAQAADGQKNLKLFKATLSWWLSHGEASKHLVSCMESLINALDTIIKNKSETEIKGIQDQLLEPRNMFFLLLLTNVLMHINRFSKYHQNKNLIFATIGCKFV